MASKSIGDLGSDSYSSPWEALSAAAKRKKEADEATPGYYDRLAESQKKTPLLKIDRYTNNADLEKQLLEANKLNQGALGDYTNAMKGVNANTGAEVAAIGNIYNGTLGKNLDTARTTYGATQGGANADAAAGLEATRNAYQSDLSAQIDALNKNLTANRTGYGAQAGGEITAEESALADLRNNRVAAARRATDLAIRDATNAQAGQFSTNNLGSGSYGMTIGLDARNRAETGLAGQIADLTSADYANIRGQRAALTGQLASLDRGQIGDIANRRFGLTDSVTGMTRADLLGNLGRTSDLNSQQYNAGRGDLGYLTDLQARHAGLVRNLQLGAAGDLLAPVTARNAANDAALRLDSANNTYTQSAPGLTPNQYRAPYRGNPGFRTPQAPGQPDSPYAGTLPPNPPGLPPVNPGGYRSPVNALANIQGIFDNAGIQMPENWSSLSPQDQGQYIQQIRQMTGQGFEDLQTVGQDYQYPPNNNYGSDQTEADYFN